MTITLSRFLARHCTPCAGASYAVADFVRAFRNETDSPMRRGDIVRELIERGYTIATDTRRDHVVGLAPKKQTVIEDDGRLILERA